MGALAIAGLAIPLMVSAETIEIDNAAIEDRLAARSALLDRPLSDAERQAFVEDYVETEILVREAVMQGLHLEDDEVRSRLADRMRRRLEGQPREPSAAELDALERAAPHRYRTPKTVTFEHVFFKTAPADPHRVLKALRSRDPTASEIGDIFWLGARMERYAPSQLLTVLGRDFTSALADLPIGRWTGPIRSGRGIHFVKLERFHPPERLPTAERMARLRHDWQAMRRAENRKKSLLDLERRYEIVIVNPERE